MTMPDELPTVPAQDVIRDLYRQIDQLTLEKRWLRQELEGIWEIMDKHFPRENGTSWSHP